MGQQDKHFDVVIIGGGPAGLSAAIWLARYLYRVCLIDAGDPRNWETNEIHGFLGCEKLTPAQIRHRGREQCRTYGVTLVDARADEVVQEEPERFVLTTDEGQRLTARRLLLAPGIQDNWPEIPGLNRCFGTTVHTCPNCDGFESRNTPSAVIGAGKKALAVALALKTWTEEVMIVTNGNTPSFSQAERDTLYRQEILVKTTPIMALEERNSHLQALRFTDGTTMGCEHLFIAMGQHARDHELGAQLGCDHNEIGLILVDQYHRTSVENVFAAGDITPGAQLAMRAAAGGTEAALSIHHSLIPDERRVHRNC